MQLLRRDIEVTTVSAFVKLFEANGKLSTSALQWYRGEGRLRKRAALLPSIARRPSHEAEEWAIYQRFRQDAAAFLPHATLGDWDWMLYMRHYGQYTRLLDWTESALVALYFAVEDGKDRAREGAVWCLDPARLNELAGHPSGGPFCAGIDSVLDSYTIESLHLARGHEEFQPMALIAPRSFDRLIAQQGVFTVTHRKAVALDSIGDKRLLARVRIPANAKPAIRLALRSLGMTRLSLFPELQSLADRG